ncbi:adenylyltransferase/sulfurtransferase MoeZ [soil metagenome]
MDPRYSRQLALPGFGEQAQSALAAARVLVIGAGGLGSTIIPALAGAGVGTIGIIDDDRVELSNLHRQHIHSTADVGRTKTQSAADSVAALNPGTRVIPIEQRFTAETAEALAAEYDLLVDGSDNFPTRYLANDVAALTDIPLVWGSVSQYGGQAGVSWDSHGPSYRDLFPAPPPPGSVLSCEVGGVLPTVVATIGSIMATEALKLLTGIGRPLLGRVTVVDALTGTFREIGYERDPQREPITGLIDYDLFCGVTATLSPAEVQQKLSTVTLLDVREPWEAEIASIEGSILVPLGSLEGQLTQLDREKPIVAYCHHGVRSESARALLQRNGFTVSHLAGGIDAWARDIDTTMARY